MDVVPAASENAANRGESRRNQPSAFPSGADGRDLGRGCLAAPLPTPALFTCTPTGAKGMDTDRTIISIATLDERVVATFALFLHRPATAEDVEDWQIVSDFLPHA